MLWTTALRLATVCFVALVLLHPGPVAGQVDRSGDRPTMQKEVRANPPALPGSGEPVLGGGLCIVESEETGEPEALELCEFVIVGEEANRTAYTLLDVPCTPPTGFPGVCYDGKLVVSRVDATTFDQGEEAERRKGVVVETRLEFRAMDTKLEQPRLKRTGTLEYTYRHQDGDPVETLTVFDAAGEKIYPAEGGADGGDSRKTLPAGMAPKTDPPTASGVRQPGSAARSPKSDGKAKRPGGGMAGGRDPEAASPASPTRRPPPSRPPGNRREPSRFDCGPASCTESCRDEAWAAKNAQRVFQSTRWQGLPWVTLGGAPSPASPGAGHPAPTTTGQGGSFDFQRLRAMQQAADDYYTAVGPTGLAPTVEAAIQTGGCGAYWAACDACLAIEAAEEERQQAQEDAAGETGGSTHSGPQAAEERCQECTWCQPAQTRYWVQYDDEVSPPEDDGPKYDCLHWVLKSPPCEPCP